MTLVQKITSKILSALAVGIQVGCVTHCLFEYVADIVLCCGPSMEPTIFSDNVILCEHITARIDKINKGDIVIAKSVTNPQQHVCKRVTGVPGEIVWTGSSYEIVPRGHVWLQGDNKENSTDSRNYGAVPKALIRGKVLCRIWPLQEICIFTNTKNDQ